MKALTATAAGLGIVLVLAGTETSLARQDVGQPTAEPVRAAPATAVALPAAGADGEATSAHAGLPAAAVDRSGASTARAPAGEPGRDAAPVPAADLDGVIDRYCTGCHGERRQRAGLTLAEFDVGQAVEKAETAEKMIVKLRAGMMPPPGARRPDGDTLQALAELLEATIDEAARAKPNPGGRTFQRLNRAEYERSVRELLALEVSAADYLPLDTKSANFDNIADVQLLSPTLLDAYLNAAADIAQLAVGDPEAPPSSRTYTNPGYASQWDRVEGAPRGTRGGISVVHTFPADGEYTFRMAFEHTTTGGFYGGTMPGEQLEISIDGERVALLEVDRWMHVADPNGVEMESGPFLVEAGPHRVTAAFLKKFEGPAEDLLSPHDWSLADRQIGVDGYGITALAHLKDLVVMGPWRTTGLSGTPSRAKIFQCHPDEGDEPRACAEEIVARLAPEAFRRPVTEAERRTLLGFYDEEAERSGFEAGVRTVIQAILASPDFVFRLEEVPDGVEPGEAYRISEVDLASRLSFFLWGLPPDDVLMELAEAGELSDEGVLEAQVRRMLDDPRSEALATRFAAQWLRLDDLDKVHPDRLLFPDFHQQLADAMRRETELFFWTLVREDRSVLELYRADWSVLNERLARHYGIPGVTGERFRKVAYPDDTRRGLFGHGSILTLTSHAGRTSPVLRGKWVMEVLLGTPPPPPPPGVPDLEETPETADGRVLTTRERMEQHRESPSCRSCHRFMDPIGLALDNFDVTGRVRIKEHGLPLDTRGELYDGTPVETPAQLQEALLARPIPLIRTFTENLMAYALGRRVEYTDKPELRAIARRAEAEGYRMSAFILGVVESDAFQLRRIGGVAEDGEESEGGAP